MQNHCSSHGYTMEHLGGEFMRRFLASVGVLFSLIGLLGSWIWLAIAGLIHQRSALGPVAPVGTAQMFELSLAVAGACFIICMMSICLSINLLSTEPARTSQD